MQKNFISKIVLVIFLTVFFSIIASAISNPKLILSVFLGVMIAATSIVVAISFKNTNQINHSIPTFLNFVNLTMSTGKSFANSFETAIVYQKKSVQPFYQRIYRLVFYLNESNDNFYFEFQTNFYKKIVQIASQTSHQKEKTHKLKLQMLEKIEIQRQEKSLRGPFLIQTLVICLLFFALTIWHFNFRDSYPKIELLSFIMFSVGLVLSILIGRPAAKI